MGFFKKKQQTQEIRAAPERQGQWLEVDGDVETFLKAIGAGRDVTEEEVMGIPALAGCIEFICGIAASVPVKLYKSGQEEQEVTDDPRLYVLNEDTGDLLTGPEWKKAFFMDYLLRGRGWTYMNMDMNRLESLHYVDDRSVSVNTNEDPIFKEATVWVNGRSYMPFQFIHMARHTKNGTQGKGLLSQSRNLLAMALNYIDFENAMVKAGGNKRGFLQSEIRLTKEQLGDLKDGFEKMYGTNYEGVVVLNKGVSFIPASSSSVEMQLAENKERNREEICSTLCLPVSVITGKATVEEFTRAIQVAVLPLLDMFNKAVNRAVLLESEKGKLKFACDTRDLQSGDILKRYQAYTEACKAGWLSKNEIRYKEKYKAIDGLDVVSMSLGDVVFDIKSGRFFVPNTGAAVDMTATEAPGEEGGNEDED